MRGRTQSKRNERRREKGRRVKRRREREYGYFEPARAKPRLTIERCHQPGIRSVPKNMMVASWLSDNGSGTSGRRCGRMSGIASTWSFLTRPPCRIRPMSVGSSNIPASGLGEMMRSMNVFRMIVRHLLVPYLGLGCGRNAH